MSAASGAVVEQAVFETGPMPAEKECLTKAVFHESKAEPVMGRFAVAQVILNRTHSEGFPKSICGVINQRGQFPFPKTSPVRRGEMRLWLEARAVATLAMQGYVAGVVKNALWFHNTRVRPSWGGMAVPVSRIGGHIFYARRG